MIGLRRGVAVALLLLALFPSSARAQTPALTVDALKNATYPVGAVLGGQAKLANGHFEVAAAPGSASKATADLVTSAIGTINSGPGAAVVLASSGGGSGVFFDLYALDATGQPIAKDSLGDRIQVRSLSINGAGHIVVDLLVHGPNEPLTSATQPERREYFVGNTLARITAPAPAATGTAGLDGAPHTSVAFEVAALVLMILGASFARTRTARERTGGAR